MTKKEGFLKFRKVPICPVCGAEMVFHRFTGPRVFKVVCLKCNPKEDINNAKYK